MPTSTHKDPEQPIARVEALGPGRAEHVARPLRRERIDQSRLDDLDPREDTFHEPRSVRARPSDLRDALDLARRVDGHTAEGLVGTRSAQHEGAHRFGRAVRCQERLQREVEERVAVDDHERAAGQRRRKPTQAATGALQDRLVHKNEGLGAALQRLRNLRRQVVQIDPHGARADLGEGVQGPLQQRAPRDRYEGLGTMLGERQEARAEPGGEHDSGGRVRLRHGPMMS